MKRIVAGILAHVDAGKTTLSEALLYATGQVRKLGRVDHGDAFLDTDVMERQRGITIFTEPAVIATPDLTITLLDTPGHVDFSAETERTLAVLDYAILVISGADGIQGHTETLWRLLNRYQVPTFVFVNKMDAPGADKTQLLAQLKKRFSDGCVDFTEPIDGERMEEIAMQNETAMDAYLDTETVPDETIRAMIARRELFPCYFGSALKMDGIEQFVAGFERFAQEPQYNGEFGARIYKVSHDAQGNRLTWLKVTGGELKAKMMLSGTAHAGDADAVAEDGQWHEKADQVRVYSGAKSTTVDTVPAGTICAVTGLTQTFPGEGLGMERDAGSPVLQPVLTYTLEPGECDIHKCLVALRELEDEDPLLHVVWQSRLEEVHLQLMGAVQLESHPADDARPVSAWTSRSDRAASCTRRRSPRRSKASAISSRCVTTPKRMCCSNRCRRARAWHTPPCAARTCSTATGSASSCSISRNASIWACSPARRSPI